MRRLHFFTGVLTGLLMAVVLQTAITFWHRSPPAAVRFAAPAIARRAATATAPFVIEGGPAPTPSAERTPPPSWTPHWFNGQQYYIVPLSFRAGPVVR